MQPSSQNSAASSPTPLCPTCSYNLSGLPVSNNTLLCPECGTHSPIKPPPPRKLRLALLPLWPWPVLWAVFWAELFTGFPPETMGSHMAWGCMIVITLSTLTAVALALPRFRHLRRLTPIPLMAACWLFGNYALFSIAWLCTHVMGSASV